MKIAIKGPEKLSESDIEQIILVFGIESLEEYQFKNFIVFFLATLLCNMI